MVSQRKIEDSFHSEWLMLLRSQKRKECSFQGFSPAEGTLVNLDFSRRSKSSDTPFIINKQSTYFKKIILYNYIRECSGTLLVFSINCLLLDSAFAG